MCVPLRTDPGSGDRPAISIGANCSLPVTSCTSSTSCDLRRSSRTADGSHVRCFRLICHTTETASCCCEWLWLPSRQYLEQPLYYDKTWRTAADWYPLWFPKRRRLAAQPLMKVAWFDTRRVGGISLRDLWNISRGHTGVTLAARYQRRFTHCFQEGTDQTGCVGNAIVTWVCLCSSTRQVETEWLQRAAEDVCFVPVPDVDNKVCTLRTWKCTAEPSLDPCSSPDETPRGEEPSRDAEQLPCWSHGMGTTSEGYSSPDFSARWGTSTLASAKRYSSVEA